MAPVARLDGIISLQIVVAVVARLLARNRLQRTFVHAVTWHATPVGFARPAPAIGEIGDRGIALAVGGRQVLVMEADRSIGERSECLVEILVYGHAVEAMQVAAGERPVERLRKADADIRVLQDPLEQTRVTLARKNLKAVR